MTEMTRRTVLKNLALGGAALATAPSLNARINLRTCDAIHSEWQEASCFYTPSILVHHAYFPSKFSS